MSAKARPVSAQSTSSRTAWGDYGARPDNQFDFGQDGVIRDDPDLSPTAMEDDSVYMGGDKNKTTTVATTSKNQSKSCFAKIGGGIRSLWATRQTEDVKGDRELHVKTTLRELIIYVVFLVILCIVTFGMTQTTMYYYTKVMSDLFLDKTHSGGGSFRTITSVEDFWKFAKGPLVDGLYWETWYNNKSMPADQQGYIYYENKLLGVPRLRQLQVSSNSCAVHDDFKSSIRDCYESYAESLENKQSFGEMDNRTAWYYRTEDELGGSSHWGKIATYSGAGYVMDLTSNKSESADIIDYLFDKRWIRRGTRVLFIDFTVYNANINLFCVIRLTVEFPPTGGAIPQATMRTVKLIRYVTVMDYFIMACEFILCLFILYYMIEEAIEIKKHKFSYFKSVWNILDILVITIALVCVGFNVYRTLKVDELLQELLDKPDQYADFEFLSYGQTQFDNAIAIAVFLAWIKIFKYISFNKTMTQLSSTLGKCAKDLAGFAVMFFIIFLAFTQLGYLLFGTQVKDFSNFQNSFFTLFRIILGDFDFDQLEAANRVLGPIFFMLFVFFVFFVLINMFLAIINDTYSEVKGDMANQKNEFEMGDYFKRGYEKMLNKLNFKHDKIVDIQKALESADINDDKQVDFDEWRQDLKTRGYADAEIEALFSKYDTDGDRVLDEEEQRKMQADLLHQKDVLKKEYDELGKIDRPESARRSTSRMSYNDGSSNESDDEDSHTKSSRSGPSQSVSYEEFTVLSRRVDRMEHSIGSIVSKIDAVLVKLEAMEKAKLKRRETMGKILDSITESDGTSDEVKREQMERLVREELERWDSETSITPQQSGRGASPSSSGHGGTRARSRPTSGGNPQYQDKVICEDKQYEETSESEIPEIPLIGEIPQPDTRLDKTEHQALIGAQCGNAEAQISGDGCLSPISLSPCGSPCPESSELTFQSDSFVWEPLNHTMQAILNEETCPKPSNKQSNLGKVEKKDLRSVTPILPGIPSASYSCTEIKMEQELCLPIPCTESSGRVDALNACNSVARQPSYEISEARLCRLSSKSSDRNDETDTRLFRPTSKSSDRNDETDTMLSRPTSKTSDRSNKTDTRLSRPTSKSSDRNNETDTRLSRPSSSKSSDRNNETDTRLSRPSSSKSSDRNNETDTRLSRPTSKSSDRNNETDTSLSRNDETDTGLSRPSSKSSDRNNKTDTRLSRPTSKSSDRNNETDIRLSRPSSKSSDRNNETDTRLSRPFSKSSDRNNETDTRLSRPTSKSSDRNNETDTRLSRPSSKRSDRNNETDTRLSRPSSKSSDRNDGSNANFSRLSSGSSDRNNETDTMLSRPSSESSDRNSDSISTLSTPASKSSVRNDDLNKTLSRPSSKGSDRNDDSKSKTFSSDRNKDSNAVNSKCPEKSLKKENNIVQKMIDDHESKKEGSIKLNLSRPSSKGSNRDTNLISSRPVVHTSSSKLAAGSFGVQAEQSDLRSSTTVSSSTDVPPESSNTLLTNSALSTGSFSAGTFEQLGDMKQNSNISMFETLPTEDINFASKTNKQDKKMFAIKTNEKGLTVEHASGDYISVVIEKKQELAQVLENNTAKTKQTETALVSEQRPFLTAKGQKVSVGTLSEMARKGTKNDLTNQTKTQTENQLKHPGSTSSANQSISKFERQSVENLRRIETQPVKNLKSKIEKQVRGSETPTGILGNMAANQHKKKGSSKFTSQLATAVSIDLPNDPSESPPSESPSFSQQMVNVDRKKGSATINSPAIYSRVVSKEVVNHGKQSLEMLPKIGPSFNNESQRLTAGKRPAPPRPTLQGTSTDSLATQGDGSHKSERKMREESAVFV